MICELCKKESFVEKHHPIPKSIIAKINPKSEFYNKTINLCHTCHQAIHNSFIEHIICLGKLNGGFNMYDGAKFIILKQYLKKNHMAVYKVWDVFWKDFVKNCLEEIEGGE